MEFEEQEQEQEQEHEEAEEEMGIPVPPSGYDSGRSKMGDAIGAEGGASRKGGPTGTVRYRECQKNHAVSIGGHAVDGCGEFLAAGEEGTLDALKCAACNCHRNFHRKEIDGEMSSYHQLQPPPPPQPHHHQYHHQFPPYYRAPPPPGAGYLHHHLTSPAMAHHRPLALPPAASGGGLSRDEEDMSNPSSSGGGGFGSGGGSGSGRKKRFRTKFTQEQKEKMLAFSDRVGWRIQKHDEAAVEQFCAETGVRRQVLKVWMHNNKHTLGKKGGGTTKLSRSGCMDIHAANSYSLPAVASDITQQLADVNAESPINSDYHPHHLILLLCPLLLLPF